jgi:hypothetical protein
MKNECDAHLIIGPGGNNYGENKVEIREVINEGKAIEPSSQVGAGMSPSETFEWLRERSNRLGEVEKENEALVAENVRLALENARLVTKPLRDRLIESEDATSVMDMRLEGGSQATRSQPSTPTGGAIQLLPCPFCGCDEILGYAIEQLDGSDAKRVHCRSCGGGFQRAGFSPVHEWNTRVNANTTPIRELVDVLTRIRQWDMLDVVEDGPYWKRTIDAALANVKETE